MKTSKNQISVGIMSTACRIPPRTMSVEDVFKGEGIPFDPAVAKRLGMDEVHVFEGQRSSQLALEASQECLSKAGLDAKEIDVVVDFSVLPQDYVVPSWCISNMIQHELGAEKAFNLGFGGGGTTNFLTALKFVVSLIRTERVRNALLIATDVAIPGNRVINREEPLTVLGDGASATIVSDARGACEILDVALWSDGRRHDALCIPGGGLAHPDRLDLYRLRIDTEAYTGEAIQGNLKKLAEQAAENAGKTLGDVQTFVTPNISLEDNVKCAEMLGLPIDDPFGGNRRQYGHVQGTDFVLNLSRMIDAGNSGHRSLAAICSHGWGYSYGAMIVDI